MEQQHAADDMDDASKIAELHQILINEKLSKAFQFLDQAMAIFHRKLSSKRVKFRTKQNSNEWIQLL